MKSGGLHIIGTERHESRRVDNQLRGRSGRQGDPGSSRFFLSLEDPLLRIFASERVAAIMDRLKMPEGEAIEHPWVTRAIENAQRKVEARNFDIRKQLLEYDDVANDQRKVIYQQRNELLESSDITETLKAMRADVVNALVDRVRPAGEPGRAVGHRRAGEGARAGAQSDAAAAAIGSRTSRISHEETLRSRIVDAAHAAYDAKVVPVDRERDAPVRARRHAAEPGHALARAPRAARPPAPGHPPARLRAEEPEAGIQARGLRAVLRHAADGSSTR